MTETGWLIGLSVAFLYGFLVGLAWKAKAHGKEIEAIMAMTRPARQVQAAKKETPQGKTPGRSRRSTDPPRFSRVPPDCSS